jgi:hypothetical protein
MSKAKTILEPSYTIPAKTPGFYLNEVFLKINFSEVTKLLTYCSSLTNRPILMDSPVG